MYYKKNASRRRRHQSNKTIVNKSIVGAISLVAGPHCKSTAFLAQPTIPIYLPPKPSFTPRLDNCVFNHAAVCRTPLSMVAKSGGRLIVSSEQFEQEVLFSGVFESSNNESPSHDSQLTLPVLVLFSAPWCGPCRLTSPVVKEVMKLYQNKINVVEISTDDLPEVATKACVLSIPTILIYYRGEVMDTIVGCVAKNVLARAVDKVLEDLGMLEDW
mmetsp:Transcript_24111/g.41283  ORF Transcript_24111/g.41283 Transcript_24111/m.41283 type:complete len:215 (-) Transcript_24111:360-1004(-)